MQMIVLRVNGFRLNWALPVGCSSLGFGYGLGVALGYQWGERVPLPLLIRLRTHITTA
jgi:hypothetical protein